MPYRTFVSGEVLTASNVMTYLANQSVITAATVASRPTSPTTGMLCYQQDVKILYVYDGTTWQQIYPIIGAGITDLTINTADIADGAVTSAKIADGSISPGDVAAGTYGISITGAAASATNSAQLNGYAQDVVENANTIVLRDSVGRVNGNGVASRSGYLMGDLATNNYLNFADGWGSFGVLFRAHYQGVYNSPAVSGRQVLVNSSGTIGTSTSSARFKENIEPLDVDTADILAIEPVSFLYKKSALEEDAEQLLEYGVIAEQVADIGLDALVFRDKDGLPEAFAYEKLPVLLLKVCREQQAQIDSLTARIEALEAK